MADDLLEEMIEQVPKELADERIAKVGLSGTAAHKGVTQLLKFDPTELPFNGGHCMHARKLFENTIIGALGNGFKIHRFSYHWAEVFVNGRKVILDSTLRGNFVAYGVPAKLAPPSEVWKFTPKAHKRYLEILERYYQSSEIWTCKQPKKWLDLIHCRREIRV